ncbi:Nramp family divalent metal transporter [Aquabacter spiritensis]|uniref:Divalent metal cation transporter MntH n=2 Tax=Xanthobacteraceae TaxID=335928 RepID=A0A4R3LN76_9HYPH|nr:Nramp family divalent metal transporter [Aquabacter spiritensis]OYX14735.1 MAG: divalent metal cation transporter [Rhizobiales bacterium 32-66-8]TCT01810.1 manganese transport protein [Aquabacter spiritensis]
MSDSQAATASRPAMEFSRISDEDRPSLPEVHASIAVPHAASWGRRLLAFLGPGYMVSVGYMDPGNWATDLAGGAQFGYTLLFVIMLSNLMAILLQALAARLGIVTDRDLAQACRAYYPRPVNYVLWFACELAIIACDLAEVIGTAIALQLLFGIPLIGGALIAALDAFLLLFLMNKGFRFLEAFVIALLVIIFGCFAIQIAAAAPPVHAILEGLFIPSPEIVTNPEMLYVAIGIIGATVMPHNLYLHSSIVQTRAYQRTEHGRRDAIKWATVDSTIALMLALFVNGAILIVSAVAFHGTGHQDVAEIGQAFELLSPLLGLGIASVLFAVALLASGLNSTVTATLAGQIVMEGFLRLRIPHWARRLLTRGIAIIPVIIVTAIYGERGTAQLLVFSQVVLSMQLPFAVLPLVQFVSDRRKMRDFVISRKVAILAWIVASLILALNFKLLYDMATGAG